MSLAESFLERAYNNMWEARGHLEMFHYSESVSSSQECIELSVKTIFLLLHGGTRESTSSARKSSRMF